MVVRALRAALALLLVSLGLVLATGAQAAAACACTQQTFERQVQRADVVFVATVDSVSAQDAGHVYSLTASRAYQGSVEHTTAVQSPAPAECGLGELKVGKDYLFLATGSAAPYDSSACQGTTGASPERVIKVEKLLDTQGEVVVAPPPPEPEMTRVEEAPPLGFARMAAPGVAAVLLGTLGLFVVRRLARR